MGIFALPPLSAEENTYLAVLKPFIADEAVPPDVPGRIQKSLTEALAFAPCQRPVPVSVALEQEDIKGLVDLIGASGEEGALEFRDDQLSLMEQAALMVIPEIDRFELMQVEGAPALCSMELSVRVVEADTSFAMDTLTLQLESEADTEEDALADVLDRLSTAAEGEFRRLSFFAAGLYIIEIIDPRRIVLSLGRADGVKRGDEFFLYPPCKQDRASGMVLIEEVVGSVSYGYVFFSEKGVMKRSKLEKADRLGFDLALHGRSMIYIETDPNREREESNYILFSGLAGFRVLPAVGFPHVRPFLGFETPLHQNLDEWPGLPVNLSGGIEARWNIGRLQFAPAAGLGVGMLFPVEEEDQFLVSHLGSLLELDINLLVHPGLRPFVTLGYTDWNFIARTYLSASGKDSYGGLSLGAGVRFRF